jgi:hypothetical protein
VLDSITDSYYNTSRFMAKNHGCLELEVTNSSMEPVVNVRTTDTSDFDIQQDFYNQKSTKVSEHAIPMQAV